MVSEYGYTTAARVAQRLRATFDGTTTPTDTVVDEIISEAEERVNEYSGTLFTSGNAFTNELYDHDGSNRIFLKHVPAQTVTSIEYSSDGGSTWTSLASSDYYLDTTYGVIEKERNASRWPHAGIRNVRITGTYGFDSVPLMIRNLVTSMAALEVLKTAVSNSANSTGGSVKVGPIEIDEPNNSSLTTVQELQSEIDSRLSKIGGSRYMTTVGKRW